MAVNDMIVRILGDSRSVERAFARSSTAAAQFNKNVTTTGAQLDKTTKKFSSFARGTAVGFGGAFALTEAVNVVRNLATVAAESQQVLGQTQVALEATGKSWAKYGEQIEDAVTQQSRLGFDDEALLRTFSLFIRNTDDVGEALRRNNLAMDVARARFIDLEQAANLVNKAALGQAGALRRLGIDAKQGASGVELLALLNEKYGGAAQAASDDASTAFERSQVAVENLQESVGRLLLPVLSKLATRLEEVATLLSNVADGLAKIGSIKVPEIDLPFNITIGGESVGDLAGSAIGKLKWFGPALPITLANELAKQFRGATEQAKPNLSKSIAQAMEDLIADALSAAGTFGITKLDTGAVVLDASVAATAAEIVAQAEGNLAEVLRVQTARRDSLAKQIVNARKTWQDAEKLAALEKRYAQAQADVIGTQKQIAANDRSAKLAADAAAKSAADTAKANKDAAKARADALKAAQKSAEQARQFRAIGLDAAGSKPPPTIANLLKQITQIKSRDLTANQQGVLERIRKVLVDPLRKATPETRSAAKGLVDAIREELDVEKKIVGPLTRTSGLNAQKLLAGLGLSPEQEREARARLSGFNSAGRALAGNLRPTGAFRTAGPVTETTVNVNLDGEQVARSTTKQQQKQKRRNPAQKRGPRSGV